MACWPVLFSALLSGDPASAAPPVKAAAAKVFVVYITVVELDADGNETILFTPKVQTTGNPAGATVELDDGRSFEFQCKLAGPGQAKLELPRLAKASGKISADEEEILKTSSPVQTAKKADEYLFRTYDVSDLIETDGEPTAADFEPLIQTLKTVAAPESWHGKATIRPFTSTKSLVIKQTAAAHKSVAEALRELKPKE